MGQWLKRQIATLNNKNSIRYEILLYIGVGAPFLVLLGLTLHYAVNVPFWDQWDLVPLLQQHNHGITNYSGLFAQHNEHRLVFPRLLMVILATLSHWNVILEMMVSIVLAAAGFAFIYSMLVRTIHKPALRLLAATLLAIILFSPIQQENWLWGWQMQWYLNTLGLAAAVWALTTWRKSPGWRVLVAIAASTVATYSLASGVFLWILCLPVFFLRQELRRYCLVWIAAATVAIGAYYWSYQSPAGHASLEFIGTHPVPVVHYWLIYIAHPLSGRINFSLPTAVLLLGSLTATIAYFWRNHHSKLQTILLPWLLLGLYTCISGAATDYSRLGLGLDQAYSSRYTTIGQYLTITLCVLFFCVLDQPHDEAKHYAYRMRYVAGMGLGLVACAILFTYVVGVVQMNADHTQRLRAYDCAHTANSVTSSCLTRLYPSRAIVWPRLEYIRAQHWGGLS
jgi:hypothetical protein